MGVNRPSSYFATIKVNKKTYGVVDCYDGHSVDAETLTKMNKHNFSFFYDVEDACYTEYYVLCSHHKLTKSQIEAIDQQLAEENDDE